MSDFPGSEGSLTGALSGIGDLLVLNLLTLVCSLPVVTAGAAFSAMHFILIQIRRGEEGYIIRTFFREFVRGFGRSTLLWLCCLPAGALAVLDLRFLVLAGGTLSILAFPVLIAGLVLFGVMLWIFPLQAKFENSARGTIRSAFMLGLGALPRTLAMLAIQGLFLYLFARTPLLLPAAVLAGFVLPAYLRSLVYYPVFQKIIDAHSDAHTKEDPDEGDPD